MSIARVRAALEKPPPILTPPDRTADFSVHIEERVPLQEIFDTPPWATSGVPGWGPEGWGPGIPLVSFDVLPLLLRREARVLGARRAGRSEAGNRRTTVPPNQTQRRHSDFPPRYRNSRGAKSTR